MASDWVRSGIRAIDFTCSIQDRVICWGQDAELHLTRAAVLPDGTVLYSGQGQVQAAQGQAVLYSGQVQVQATQGQVVLYSGKGQVQAAQGQSVLYSGQGQVQAAQGQSVLPGRCSI